jgi:integrase
VIESTAGNLILFRLAACCGLRVSEIAHLHMADVRTDGSRPHLRIRRAAAKGHKARVVPLWWDAGTLAYITAWKVSRANQNQHARDVAEPGVQEAVEFLVRDKVVSQRPVFGSQFLLRWLGFAGMAGEVEALVMRRGLALGGLKRTQADGDRVVRTRFNFDVVRRIGVAEVNELSVEQPIQVFRLRTVAA